MAQANSSKHHGNLRAVIYTKVSPSKGTTQTNNVDNRREIQIEVCQRKASQMEATIVGWYNDDLPDSEFRKGLGHLMERVIGDQDVDVVIVDCLGTLAQDKAGQFELRNLLRHGRARLAIASPDRVAVSGRAP